MPIIWNWFFLMQIIALDSRFKYDINRRFLASPNVVIISVCRVIFRLIIDVQISTDLYCPTVIESANNILLIWTKQHKLYKIYRKYCLIMRHQ